MPGAQRLGTDDLAEAVGVAVQAFERDPFFRHCFTGSDRRYLRQLRAGFGMLFGASLQRGGLLFGVRSEGDLVGTVALENPGRPLSWGDLMHSTLLLRPLVALALNGGPRAISATGPLGPRCAYPATFRTALLRAGPGSAARVPRQGVRPCTHGTFAPGSRRPFRSRRSRTRHRHRQEPVLLPASRLRGYRYRRYRRLRHVLYVSPQLAVTESTLSLP